MSFFSTARRIGGAVAVAALCTCGTLDRFDVETSAETTIAKATVLEGLLDTLDVDAFDDLDFSQEIANQGVSEDQIDSVTISSFVIHTEAGSGATLSFIDSVAFYAEADGLDRVLVASSADFAGKSEVALSLTGAELKPYLIAPSVTLSAEVSGTRPAQDTKLTADVTLSVDATVPGCE